MNVQEVLGGVHDALTVRRVYGDPIERDGVIVVPAAVVGGGGGGGGGGTEAGAAFGLTARPAGAFVIRDGTVDWQPAVDANRIVAGIVRVAVLVLLVVRSSVRRRARRRRRARS